MSIIAIVIKYWREIAVALLILLLIAVGFYLRSVFAERDQLKAANSVLAAQLKDAAQTQELANKFTEAISQIKIRSNVNVQRIESLPKPVFVDNSAPLLLVPGGVLQSVYPPPAASGAATGNASDRSVAAGKPGS